MLQQQKGIALLHVRLLVIANLSVTIHFSRDAEVR